MSLLPKFEWKRAASSHALRPDVILPGEQPGSFILFPHFYLRAFHSLRKPDLR